MDSGVEVRAAMKVDAGVEEKTARRSKKVGMTNLP